MQLVIGFGFISELLTKWREFFKPITERSNAEPRQTRITFYNQVKTALKTLVISFNALHEIAPMLPWLLTRLENYIYNNVLKSFRHFSSQST